MAHITKEEENYIRLQQLIKGVSQKAARCFFDQEFAPVCLGKSIKQASNKLNDLKIKKVINTEQWNLLFPKYGKEFYL